MHQDRVSVRLGPRDGRRPRCVPPAPGRFSTTKGWPNCSDSRCATVRAMMSVALPAVNGTMTVTRLLGHDCASASP